MHRPSQESFGPPKFPAFLSTHATLFVDPSRRAHQHARSVLASLAWPRHSGEYKQAGTVTPSPPALCSVTRLYHLCQVQARLQGVSQIPRSPAGRSPLRPMWFPVYASAVSFGCKPPPQLRQSRHEATLGMGHALPSWDFYPARNAKLLGAQRRRAERPRIDHTMEKLVAGTASPI